LEESGEKEVRKGLVFCYSWTLEQQNRCFEMSKRRFCHLKTVFLDGKYIVFALQV